MSVRIRLCMCARVMNNYLTAAVSSGFVAVTILSHSRTLLDSVTIDTVFDKSHNPLASVCCSN